MLCGSPFFYVDGGATALTLVCRQSTVDGRLSSVFSLQSSAGFTTGRADVRLPPSVSTNKKILIAPHPCPTSHRCPKCPICPAKNKKTSHRLDHSNGAAGAFLGLIGLLGLIGQRLTEWQALFQNVFCGAAPALRFSEKNFRLRLIRVPQVPDVPNVTSVLKKIKLPHDSRYACRTGRTGRTRRL